MVEEGICHSFEGPLPVIAINGKFAAFAATDDDVVPTIAICIGPGCCRAQLAEFAWQPWLALKVMLVVGLVYWLLTVFSPETAQKLRESVKL